MTHGFIWSASRIEDGRMKTLTVISSTGYAIALLGMTAVAQIAPATAPSSSPVDLKFDFSTVPLQQDYIRVAPSALYSDAAGYGYEPGAQVAIGDNGRITTSTKPFLFSAKVPEGNFEVTVAFGNSARSTTTTIKAESGRLMQERVNLPAGQVAQRTFTVNVRTPQLPQLPLNATGREKVSLDQFDRGNVRDWDNKLTIEIVSPQAALRSIHIVSAPPDTPTVYLAGDSTVTDRDGGPDVSWGQILPVFFASGVAVANEAQSGETLKSFANALRLDKILSQMKRGDFLFIQFMHNDSKANWPQTYVDPESTYKAYLRVYIAEARFRGATPVLVTAMDRGTRGTGAPTHGHDGYPDAMRQVAQEEHVALIDLYSMSDVFYNAAGADAPKILADGTHSTAYGGYEFAECVATSIRESKLDLARFIVSGFQSFDPAHPDSAESLDLESLFSSEGGRSSRRETPPANSGPGPL